MLITIRSLRFMLAIVIVLLCGQAERTYAQYTCQAPLKLTSNTGPDVGPVWDTNSETIAYLKVEGSAAQIDGVQSSNPSSAGPLATGPVINFGIGLSLSWVGTTGLLITDERESAEEYMTFDTTQAPFVRDVADGSKLAFTRILKLTNGAGTMITASRDGTDPTILLFGVL